MRNLASRIGKPVLSTLRVILLSGWRLPGWSVLFNTTLGKRHPQISRNVGVWLPTIRSFAEFEGPLKLEVSGTGMLIALGKRTCQYIPLGPFSAQSLKNSHAVWSNIVENGPHELRELTHYKFDLKETNIETTGWMTRHCPVPIANRSVVLCSVLEVLQAHAVRGILPQPVHKKLTERFGDFATNHPIAKQRADELLAREWTLSTAHGDLNPSNIMLQDGHPVLIDIDRVQVCFPALYDIIHFGVELVAKGRRVPWLDVLENADALSECIEIIGNYLEKIEPETDEGELFDTYFVLRVALFPQNMGNSARWLRLVGETMELFSNDRLAADRLVQTTCQ